MQIICLSLREETSRVAFIKTNGSQIHINEVGVIDDPLLEYVLIGNVEALSDSLTQLSKKGQYKHLLISYPSYLGHTDCFKETAIPGKELYHVLPSLIYKHFEVENKKEYCTDAALVIPEQDGIWVTGIYLHSKFTDVITEAAKISGYKQYEGEPEAVAAARLIQESNHLNYLIEIATESSSITCYYPQKGMFSIPVPGLGWDVILSRGGIQKLNYQIGIADLASQKIFGLADITSENTGIYILSDQSEQLLDTLLGQTGRLQTFHIPGTIRSKLSPELLLNSISIIGLGLKPTAVKMNLQEIDLYRGKAGLSFEKIFQKIPIINQIAASR